MPRLSSTGERLGRPAAASFAVGRLSACIRSTGRPGLKGAAAIGKGAAGLSARPAEPMLIRPGPRLHAQSPTIIALLGTAAADQSAHVERKESREDEAAVGIHRQVSTVPASFAAGTKQPKDRRQHRYRLRTPAVMQNSGVWPLKNMDRTHPSLHFHGLSRHGPPPDVPRIPKPNSFAARFRDAPSGCPATRAPFDAAIRTKLAARTKRAVQIVTEPTIERPYLPPCGPLHIFGRKVRHQCAACALTGGRLVPVGAITGSDIAAGGGRIADVEARCVSIRARQRQPQGGG